MSNRQTNHGKLRRRLKGGRRQRFLRYESFEPRLPLAIDFGDAPDASLGTGLGNFQTSLSDNGPRHTIVPGLLLGANVDGELDATPNLRATGDDITNQPDDEDGLLEPAQDLILTANTAPIVRVRATNTTGTAATLYGWIDYNRDGVFDNATERASIAVPSGTSNASFNLTFPTISASAAAGPTFARFRLSTEVAAANPIGAAGDGEVEDYGATITRISNGIADVAKSKKIASGLNGGPNLATYDAFGISTASLGDLDGDGVADLAVGAPGDDTGGAYRGAVHVLLMNSSGTVKNSVKIASGLNGGPTLANSDVFGFSLAPLGDLDGDGITDLAVGAAYDDTGGTDRGAVHILFLNATGTVKSSVKLASNINGGPTLANGDQFGKSVTSLGDLDGDGVFDLAIGATGDDTGGSSRGAVHVVLLNRNGTSKSSLKVANNTNGGPALANLDLFGSAVTSIGDLDGDGITDVAVGSPGDNTGSSLRGAFYVLLLNASGSVKSSVKIASSTNGGPVLASANRFGSSLAALGDLDGDGITDLAVGATGDSTGGTNRGAVHVLLMNSNGTVKSNSKIANGLNGAPSLADNDNFGRSIAVLGDLDGDGVSDLAVGANGDQTGGSTRGAAHVLFLQARPNPDFGDAPDTGSGVGQRNYQTSLADNGPRHDISATQTTLFLGARVDGEADAASNVLANSDDLGIDDEDGVNEPGQDLDITVASRPVVRLRATNSTGSLASLYGWIDYNQDGVFDNATERAFAGVPSGTTNGIFNLTFPTVPAGTPPGRTYARFRLSTDLAAAGIPTGPASDGEVEDYPATIALRADGTTDSLKYVKLASGTNGTPTLLNGDYFGTAIAALGDLDGDGVGDIAVGANRDDTGGTNRGAVYVLFLKPDGSVKTSVKLASGLNGGPVLANGDIFGGAVAVVGDLDGDGNTELAVGATGSATASGFTGAVHVLFLNSNGTVKSSVKIANGLNGGPIGDTDAFGSAIASIGDLDGDGVPDLAVGAFLADANFTRNAGAIYILLLNPTGTVKSNTRIAPSNAGNIADGYFGIGIASLGDVDGDGVTDLAVGADGDSLGGFRGRAYLLQLNANGTLKSSIDLSTTSGAPVLADGDLFGSGVATLGDIDGDGITDLAVGAMGDDTGGFNFGAVHILRLNANGTIKSRLKLASGSNGIPSLVVSGYFGNALSAVGDINGDGVVDLAVGAFHDNALGTGRGAVYTLPMHATDFQRPSFQSIARRNPLTNITNSDSVIFRVSFDEDVQNVSSADFVVAGSATASISNVTSVSSSVYDVVISGGNLATFNGTIGLNLASGQNITDLAGNTLSTIEPPIDETYLLDNAAPTVTSYVRKIPSTNLTNADAVTFRVTLSENVQGLDVTDFVASGGTTATISGVAIVSAQIYDVTLSGGNLAFFNGAVGLDLATAQNITDLAGNSLPSGEPLVDETFTLDNAPPTITSFARQTPLADATNADSLIFRVSFTEDVQAVDPVDFAVDGATTATVSSLMPISAGIYDLTISGGNLASLNGVVGLKLAPGQSITDLVGNTLPSGEPPIDEEYVLDNTPPAILSFSRHLPATATTNADALVFRAVFSEDVQNVNATDFAVAGSTTATITNVTPVSMSIYELTISGGDLATFNGAVGLNLAIGQNITDLVGNALSLAEPPAEENYLLDHNPPRLVSFARQAPTNAITTATSLVFRATFSETLFNIDAADFLVTGASAMVTNVALVSPESYDLTVSGGNLATFTGNVGIDLRGAQNISDLTGNALPTAEPLTDEVYQLDHELPGVVVDVASSQPDPVAGGEVRFRVVFSEPVTGFSLDDLDFTGSSFPGALSALISGDGPEYEVVVSGMSGTGVVRLTVKAGAVTDAAGNQSLVSTSADHEVLWYTPTPLQVAGIDVLELQAGAVVGAVTIPGLPVGRNVTLAVNDPRFEIASGQLRLKSDQSLSRVTESSVPIQLTLQDGGLAIVQSLTLNVLENLFPWHNALRPEDAQGNGGVTVDDAIFVIRQLRRTGSGTLTVPKPAALLGGSYYDVDRNGQLNVQDAVAIIRYLRRNRAAEGESAFSLTAVSDASPTSVLAPSSVDLALLNYQQPKRRERQGG